MNARFVEKLLALTFRLELALVGGKVPAPDLLNLSVGKILPAGTSRATHPPYSPLEVMTAFEAVPVRSGKHRGAQLLDRVPKVKPEPENTI